MSRRPPSEEKQIYEEPDRCRLERGRSRDAGRRTMPQTRHRNVTYYLWKRKYSGVHVSESQRLRELEAENAKLKRMFADLALKNAAIKDALNRKS